MNKINVLYQNLNFKKSGECGIDDNLDAPIFASDETLTDLLRKASISNYDKGLKNAASSKAANTFKKHPRYITDDSMVSVTDTNTPTDSLADKSRIENIIRKVTFKRHVKMESSEPSLIKTIPDYKIINTNVIIPDNKIKDCLQELSDRARKEVSEEESRKIAKTEEFLGVKLKSYLIKICSWMQETRSSITSGIMPIESSEDYFRRQRRAAEFANRFNRNYLYQLSRQLIELRRHTQKTSLASSRPGAPNTARLLTNACQTVLQAIQSYCNHVPTTVPIRGNSEGTVHSKFCELLKDTCDLCRIIKKLSCTYYDVANVLPLVENCMLYDFYLKYFCLKQFGEQCVLKNCAHDIEADSKSLVIIVQENLMKRGEIETKPLPKPKTSPKKKGGISQHDKKHFDVPFHKRNPLESRLSMYSVAFKKNQKNPNWKKNAEKLAHQRFNVQSRYKNPKQPLPPVIEPNPNNHVILENKCKSIAVKQSHLSCSGSNVSTELVNINEDEIPTLVEMDSKHEATSNPEGIRSRLEPLLQSLVAEVSAGKQEDLLAQGVCEDMLLKLRDLLNQVQRPVQNSGPEIIDKKKFHSKHHVSVTGPKNAKLICIKDKSLFESKTEVKTSVCRLEEPLPHPKSLSVLPALERKQSRKVAESNSQTMANLSKQYTINIIQYKINFHKYTKPLMMYRKSSQVLPWILTGKITDALFEHLMVSVINEINIDGLAEKMYRSEFESFC